MGSLALRVKILPTDPKMKAEGILEEINKIENIEINIIKHHSQPIAYGLEALIADLIISDEEGKINELEEIMEVNNKISQMDIIAMSKISTRK